jgi:hypothetical protein
MSVREAGNPELYAHVQQQNLLRQYDLLTNCVEICLSKGIEAFDKYMLWSLNAVAVSNIAQFGGRFREQPIYVGDHIPPHFEKVPNLIDQCLSLIHETWTINDHPTILPAYALWRLNWIHPFIEGNGRTARAASYLLICSSRGDCYRARRSFRSGFERTGSLITTRCAPRTVTGTTVTSTSMNWLRICWNFWRSNSPTADDSRASQHWDVDAARFRRLDRYLVTRIRMPHNACPRIGSENTLKPFGGGRSSISDNHHPRV